MRITVLVVCVHGVIVGQSIERIGCNIVCGGDSACSGEGCIGNGNIGAATCLLAFPKFQSSLLGAAVFFKVTLPGAVVAFAGVVCRWCRKRFGVWGCLSAVLGVVVCHPAVVAVVAIAVLGHRSSAPANSAPEKRAADERTGAARRRVAHRRSAPLMSAPEQRAAE